MKVRYKGFEIGARREKTPTGTRVICFFARRLADDWHLFSEATSASKSVRAVVEEVKARLDQAILTEGESEHLDLAHWRQAGADKEHPISLPPVILILGDDETNLDGAED